MIKIKRNLVFASLLLIILLIISSCAKAECKTSADCASRTCFASKCEDKKCVYSLKQNCCGNRINDTIEDGKPGNQCTCPQDYGKCEGKGKIKAGSRIEDATYMRYYCNADSQCVLGVEKTDILPQNYLDTIDIGFFKASSVVRYNKPFDIKKDSFAFTISLDNAGKYLVPPISITKIRLLYSSEYTRLEQLIAEQDLNEVLNNIGDEVKMNMPLNLNYRTQEVEEVGSLRYVIDYVYTKKVASGKVGGIDIFTNESVRASYTSPTKPVFFVRSG